MELPLHFYGEGLVCFATVGGGDAEECLSAMCVGLMIVTNNSAYNQQSVERSHSILQSIPEQESNRRQWTNSPSHLRIIWRDSLVILSFE